MSANQKPPKLGHDVCSEGSHLIELVDAEGNKQMLKDNGMVRFDCNKCAFFMLTVSNPGPLRCPRCSDPMVLSWQRIQVRFTLEITPTTESY
jgi:hypothetical protein